MSDKISKEEYLYNNTINSSDNNAIINLSYNSAPNLNVGALGHILESSQTISSIKHNSSEDISASLSETIRNMTFKSSETSGDSNQINNNSINSYKSDENNKTDSSKNHKQDKSKEFNYPKSKESDNDKSKSSEKDKSNKNKKNEKSKGEHNKTIKKENNNLMTKDKIKSFGNNPFFQEEKSNINSFSLFNINFLNMKKEEKESEKKEEKDDEEKINIKPKEKINLSKGEDKDSQILNSILKEKKELKAKEEMLNKKEKDLLKREKLIREAEKKWKTKVYFGQMMSNYQKKKTQKNSMKVSDINEAKEGKDKIIPKDKMEISNKKISSGLIDEKNTEDKKEKKENSKSDESEK